MSFRNIRRRSSSLNSSLLLSTRRSSITQKDLEHIQAILHKTKRISNHLLLLIMALSPVFIFSYHYWLTHSQASILELFKDNAFTLHSIKSEFLSQLLSPVSWLSILLLVQLQLLFLWFLPALEHEVVTNLGYKFQARRNSFDSCILICLLYILGSTIGIFQGEVVFNHWLGIMLSLSVVCTLLQTYLFTFGWNKSTSSSECDDESIIVQVFFGRDLQPLLFDVDIKHFITTRIMLTLWPIYIISAICYHKNRFEKCSDCLMICSLLQLVYTGRRQWFEYLTTNLDNQNDRMGFYRIWGVVVFLPTLYTTPITIMSQADTSPSLLRCVTFLIFGLFFQYLNTDADLQKYRFRMAEGRIKIGNKDPFYIVAKYRKENGENGTQLLLGSGYWSICRHFNYTTEWLSFLFWTLTLPDFYSAGILPVVFLMVLLYGRMTRDEMRCLCKYNHIWLQYTLKVPYLFLPSVF